MPCHSVGFRCVHCSSTSPILQGLWFRRVHRESQQFKIFADGNADTLTCEDSYGSTSAYKGLLELHGWHDRQPQLNELLRLGEWDAMTDLISDDVLDAFLCCGARGRSRSSRR